MQFSSKEGGDPFDDAANRTALAGSFLSEAPSVPILFLRLFKRPLLRDSYPCLKAIVLKAFLFKAFLKAFV